MTTITRKTSNYSNRLKRAEKRKVGYRQGRIIDLDGFLVFPEEMRKIRKASKLPVRAVEPVESYGDSQMNYKLTIDETDHYSTAYYTFNHIHIDAGFETEVKHKTRYLVDSTRDLEQMVADTISHEVLHHVLYHFVDIPACAGLDRIIGYRNTFFDLEAGI